VRETFGRQVSYSSPDIQSKIDQLSEQQRSQIISTSEIDDRTMHEIYAHPFLKSVMAGVGSMMCSYSKSFALYPLCPFLDKT